MVSLVLGAVAKILLSDLKAFTSDCLAELILKKKESVIFLCCLVVFIERAGWGDQAIAVGSTHRRFVAKAAVRNICTLAAFLLQLKQLVFGNFQGNESATRAVRAYIRDLPVDKAIVKLDFNVIFILLKR